MKTIFQLPLALTAALLFAACNRDEPEPEPTGTITYQNETRALDEGWIEFNSQNPDGTRSIDVMLLSEGIDWARGEGFAGKGHMVLLFFNSSEPSRVADGTYAFDSTGGAQTFDSGTLVVDWDFTVSPVTRVEAPEVTGGTVVVASAGSGYRLTFDCPLNNGERLVGTYEGPLENIE